MVTRSTRLFGPVEINGMPTKVFGPLEDSAILKNLRIVLPGGAPSPVAVIYGINSTNEEDLLGEVELQGAPRMFTDGTWLIIEPGEELWIVVTGGFATISGHGTLLPAGGEFP